MRKLFKNVMVDVTADIEKFEPFIKDGSISKEITGYVKSCNHEDDNVNEEYFCVNKCDGIPEYAMYLNKGTTIKDFNVKIKENLLTLTVRLGDDSLVILVAGKEDDTEFLLDTVEELFLYSEVI